MKHYEDHPLAEIFPLMDDDKSQRLIDSISANGLRTPIAIFEGKILDGRNRYRACIAAGVEPTFVKYTKDDAFEFVMDANLNRRDLTESQKAMVAANIANTPRGGDRPTKVSEETLAKVPQETMITIEEAAKLLRVSVSSVKRARRVMKTGSKKAIKAIKSGKSTVVKVLREVEEKAQEEGRPATLTALFDELNHELPEIITEDWARASKAREYMTMLTKVKSYVNAGIELNDPIFREVNQDLIAHLTNAFRQLKQVIPYSICTSCQGHRRKGCDFCKGRGFLSEFLYKTCVPSEIKKMREPAAK